MINKAGLLGNVSNAFGGRQGMLTSGLSMMFGGPQMQQQGLMMGLQNGSQLQAENRKTQQAEAQRNKTLEYLQQSNPKLAAMVQAGMPVEKAWGQALEAQAPQKPATSAIENYQFAKQNGYEGSFMDFQTANKSGTNVTVNNANQNPMPGLSKLGEGMSYLYDTEGNVKVDGRGVPMSAPISGTKADLDAQKRQNAAQNAKEMRERSGGVVIEDIDRAMSIIDNGGFFNGTGIEGAVTQHIPNTDGYALGNLLETVKANAGFDKLQQMRDASPTGGALGQVSERELSFLQAAIGNLDQSQDEATLKYNLERVKRIYQEIIHGPNGAQQQTQSGTPDFSAMSDQELEAIANGR